MYSNILTNLPTKISYKIISTIPLLHKPPRNSPAQSITSRNGHEFHSNQHKNFNINHLKNLDATPKNTLGETWQLETRETSNSQTAHVNPAKFSKKLSQNLGPICASAVLSTLLVHKHPSSLMPQPLSAKILIRVECVRRANCGTAPRNINLRTKQGKIAPEFQHTIPISDFLKRLNKVVGGWPNINRVKLNYDNNCQAPESQREPTNRTDYKNKRTDDGPFLFGAQSSFSIFWSVPKRLAFKGELVRKVERRERRSGLERRTYRRASDNGPSRRLWSVRMERNKPKCLYSLSDLVER